jgi:hypothetical protein
MLAEILAWGTIGIVYAFAFGALALPKHWYRTAQVLFLSATAMACTKVLWWALTSTRPQSWRILFGVLGCLAFIGAAIWFTRKVQADIRTGDETEQIRSFYDLLSPEEKRVLRFILPLHRSPTNLNVGQITALESIQQKTGFVGRNYTTGSYELNPQTVDGLKILLPADAGLYGKIICREIALVLNAKDQIYDCFLILSVKVTNDGVATMVSRWQLDLFWEGVEYPSVRHSVEGYYVKYPSSHANDPEMKVERRPLTEFPNNEEITNANYKTGWLRFKVGTFPIEAVDRQRLRREVILKLQAFDSKDNPRLIYEGTTDGLSGCGSIERPE